MAEEEETRRYPTGFRFDPFDEELITYYLKPMIMGTTLPSNIINFRQVYGPCSNPWSVFDPNDHRSWHRSPALKEKCMFVFTKLTKLATSGRTNSKNTSKKAGCGTWVGKGKRDQIVDGKGNVIGDKRYLVFEINDIHSAATGFGFGFDLSKIGFFGMHEYSLSGVNADLNSSDSIVLCKIIHDSSKYCLVNFKSGTKVAANVSTSSSQAPKKEQNSYKTSKEISFVRAENLSVLHSGVSVGENLDENKTLTLKNLTVMDSGACDNLKESRTLNSDLVVTNSDVGGPYAATQYNNGFQELDAFCGGFCDRSSSEAHKKEENNENFEGIGSVTAENSTVLDSGFGNWPGAQFNNDVLELDDLCGGFAFDDLINWDIDQIMSGFQSTRGAIPRQQ